MIQLEELKSKLLELKPQIDDYRSAIGMDDLVKKQQELEEKTADPNFWNDLENSSRVLQQISQIKAKVATYTKMESDYEDLATLIEIAMEEQDESSYAEIDVYKRQMMNVTVGKLLEQVAEKYPDDEAVKFTDRDYRRTWKEFNEEAETIAKGFLEMGIRKGDHVAIWATNVPEWMLTFFACTKIGAVLVTVNTAYKVFELEYLLRQSDSKMLVMIDNFKKNDYVQVVNELCPTLKDCKPGEYDNPMLPYLKTVVYAGNQETAPAGMVHWKELYQKAEKIDDKTFREIYDSINPQDICNMQYTSGTTGFPKGVMLTHYNIVNLSLIHI